MESDEIVKTSPEANTMIVRAWLYRLLAELETNKVIEAEKNENANLTTLKILFKY